MAGEGGGDKDPNDGSFEDLLGRLPFTRVYEFGNPYYTCPKKDPETGVVCGQNHHPDTACPVQK